jgi:hypothetical protein
LTSAADSDDEFRSAKPARQGGRAKVARERPSILKPLCKRERDIERPMLVCSELFIYFESPVHAHRRRHLAGPRMSAGIAFDILVTDRLRIDRRSAQETI